MLLSSRLRVVRLLSAESAETSLSEQLFRVSEVSSVCSAMVCKSAELRDLPVTVRALETIVYSSPASVSLFSSSSLSVSYTHLDVYKRQPFGMVQSTGACPKCGGTGKIIHEPCPTCRGKGAIRRNKKITVNIPAGIDDGQTVSLKGQGSAGTNGGPAGDLLVTVAVRESDKFERDGTSVLSEATVSFAQAALGADLQVDTIDGPVKLTIPEGTQPGTVFRLRGKGIPYLRGSGRGDQYVTVNVAVPKGLNSRQKEALREYARAMGEEAGESGGLFKKKKKS